MGDITVTLKDGSVRVFNEKGRSGGSYSNSLRYEIGFLVVIDEYGAETAFPTDTVKQVNTTAPRSSW